MVDVNKEIEAYKYVREKLTVESVIRTPSFILVKARLECPVYFAFYQNFIVCSGDYGEWVFDCTWKTAEQQIPTSSYYLFGKLSRNTRATKFDSSVVDSELEEILHDLRDELFESGRLSEEDQDSVEEIFEDFKYAMQDADEYRICSIVDKFADDMSPFYQFDGEELSNYYKIGERLNGQLACNLVMLDCLRENNVLFDTETYKEKN
ncbi:MAG: hypothetical protein NC218_01625 [Acetobacter sp.]|nr:hypothetical protein [Acetobacter sp.]